MGGALAELIYSTGDMDMSRYSGLTAVTFRERQAKSTHTAPAVNTQRPGENSDGS